MLSNFNIKFLHKVSVQIRFNDIDVVGHVNNAMYLQYLDFARMDYFKQVFANIIDWRKESLILAKIEMEYFEPVFLGDKISVYTKIEKIGNKSIQMHQHIVKDDNEEEELVASCTSILVGYDYTKQSSMKISQDWKEKVLDYEKNVLIKSSPF